MPKHPDVKPAGSALMTGIAPQPRLAGKAGVLTRVSVNAVKELFAMLLPNKLSVRALPEL